ncbi:hypothetical protein AtDm6_0549 [Acetobacter tropicalis]|uniref:Uncharacterized protein n=1 Tax=Acetobacter tropicalis TaxID=104102 RepID=A0A094YXF3_9PROT|nr:hypothetical protein AtDm6_0549 [Acetobacter tropicalis]
MTWWTLPPSAQACSFMKGEAEPPDTREKEAGSVNKEKVQLDD